MWCYGNIYPNFFFFLTWFISSSFIIHNLYLDQVLTMHFFQVSTAVLSITAKAKKKEKEKEKKEKDEEKMEVVGL